jgi:hypothetical protein
MRDGVGGKMGVESGKCRDNFKYCIIPNFRTSNTLYKILRIFAEYSAKFRELELTSPQKIPSSSELQKSNLRKHSTTVCTHVVELNMLMRTRQSVTSRTILAGTTSWAQTTVTNSKTDVERNKKPTNLITLFGKSGDAEVKIVVYYTRHAVKYLVIPCLYLGTEIQQSLVSFEVKTHTVKAFFVAMTCEEFAVFSPEKTGGFPTRTV